LNEESIRGMNIKTYNNLYKDHYPRQSYEVKNKIRIILSQNFVQKCSGKKVLDIGFGTGDVLLNLSEKGADCYGIEIVKSAIENFHSNFEHDNINENIHLIIGNAENLPYLSRSFDLVICSHVLEHVKDDRKMMEEIGRVLREGGKCILLIPTSEWHTSLHYREYSITSIKSLLTNTNLDIINYRYYTSFFLKKILSLKDTPKISIPSRDNASFSLFIHLYYKLIVPLLLFISSIDDFFAKSNGTEILIILEKAQSAIVTRIK